MDTQTQLRLSKHVIPPGKEKDAQVQIIAVGSPEGVMIVTNDTMRATVPWDKLEDMEHLADAYANLQVWQFRVAVELLGQISRLAAVFQ